MKYDYVCIECGRSYPIEPGRYLCDDCAPKQTADQPLRGQLEVRLSGSPPADWEALKDLGKNPRLDLSVPEVDVRGLLPVPKEYFPPIPVGNTPLWEPRRLREELGLEGLFLKDDTANPTGSLKDRASYLVAAFALQHGLEDIIVASTGNAGSSMAGVAAAAGLNVRLYLPASAPVAKIVQAMQYGANVIKVEGTYDDAFDQSLAYVNEHGGLSRNTAHNPLTVEGKKTVSLEIFRQLRASMPDVVYVPTGDGVIISGVFKGFEDLVTLGLADKVPEVVCVQAEGSAALTRALAAGSFGVPEAAHTIADSISVDVPRGGLFALGRLQRHGGRCVTVSDEAIVSAQRRLSSSSGLFAEPAAAAAFAGLLADMDAGKGPGKKDRAVVLLTGNGLKDIATAAKGVEA
ncbi:MAG: pyridoxal-5'-phosphate-dependent protein subunit beta [Spirochaetes bacterium]|nr:MAG: pyridoxal-5'-phosphate-dependent protein subunit beta [Spirochaetota bacterium]